MEEKEGEVHSKEMALAAQSFVPDSMFVSS